MILYQVCMSEINFSSCLFRNLTAHFKSEIMDHYNNAHTCTLIDY